LLSGQSRQRDTLVSSALEECMADGPATAAGADWELLRSGIRLMALRAIGDPEAADEVAQETLSRAVQALRAPPANLGAYVAGIARHVIADHFRATQREVSLERLHPDVLRTEATDPLASLCSEGEHAQVRRALGELSADDRELLHLSYFEGLSPTEIAERMGAPAERIRQRKLRALARLRRAFDGASQPRHEKTAAPTMDEDPGARAEARRSTE
jgi:RNA polymerase sigma-70 factor (ECF subfamily)